MSSGDHYFVNLLLISSIAISVTQIGYYLLISEVYLIRKNKLDKKTDCRERQQL